MRVIDWKGIADIRHHGADWIVAPCADDMSLLKLEGLVARINDVIDQAYAAGRRDQQAVGGQVK